MGLARRKDIASRHAGADCSIREPLAALLLDERGRIVDCDDGVGRMFGYEHRELLSRHISRLLPQLGIDRLIKNDEINPMMRFRFRIGARFVAQRKDGSTFQPALCLVNLGEPGQPRLRLIVRHG